MDSGDFSAILTVARRTHRCPECDAELDYRERPKSAFCSGRCSIRFNDRRRYHETAEYQRARSRSYYDRHRETVLAKARTRRLAERPDLRDRKCEECGAQLEGRQRVVCSPRCRDARYRRLHPDAYQAKEQRKAERRKARRRLASAA